MIFHVVGRVLISGCYATARAAAVLLGTVFVIPGGCYGIQDISLVSARLLLCYSIWLLGC